MSREAAVPQFTDLKGRTWAIAITHGDAVRIRKELAVSFYHLCDKESEGLGELLSDPEKFVAVMFSLVEAKANKDGVTPEDFGSSIDGATLEAMGDAFLAALAFFFPNKQARIAIQETAKKAKEVGALLETKLRSQIAAITPESLIKALEIKSSGKSTESPVAAELIQAP